MGTFFKPIAMLGGAWRKNCRTVEDLPPPYAEHDKSYEKANKVNDSISNLPCVIRSFHSSFFPLLRPLLLSSFFHEEIWFSIAASQVGKFKPTYR